MAEPPKPSRVFSDLPPAVASGTSVTQGSAGDMVVVHMRRDMARLFVRLQQLRKERGRALVDMQALTVEACGKVESFG